jgi:hypothetical protein
MNGLNRNQEFPMDCLMRGVPNMSVDSAPTVAGGFSPPASHERLTLPHADDTGSLGIAPLIGKATCPDADLGSGRRF